MYLRQHPARSIRTLATGLHFLHLRYQYPHAAPSPTEVIGIDPDRLQYSLASDDRPTPWYTRGVVGGDWDRRKESFWSTPLRRGLRQRFAEGRPWEETDYYKSALEELRHGGRLKRLDDDTQSLEGFIDYLDQIDALYESMCQDRFHPESPITVNIGRDGSVMLDHGNHRSTLAKIAAVPTIYATVRYRHEEWQALRQRALASDDIEWVDPELRAHPDLPVAVD